MEFYIFIIALTIFIVTLVITGTLKKYVVSQDVNVSQGDATQNTMQSTSNDMQSTSNDMQSTSNDMQSTSNDMQSTMQSTSNDMQNTSNDMQQILEQDPMQNTKESFSYDNTMPLFMESKNPEDYIGDNRIYNPRPNISSI